MAKKYITRCIVRRKVNGESKYLPKGSFIDDLTPEEIKQGLSQHWLKEVGTDEEPTPAASGKYSKKTKHEHDELIAKAQELGIEGWESLSTDELRQRVMEAQV